MKTKPTRNTDGAATRNPDGSTSNWDLSEQMTEGVDDTRSRQVTAARAIATGTPAARAYRTYGLTPDGKDSRDDCK